MRVFKNTPTKGSVRIIIFRDRSEGEDAWYGVALDFNIVVSAESREKAYLLLIEAIDGYIHTINSIKGLSDFSPLNQKPEEEYLKLWESLTEGKPTPSPYQVEFFGLRNLYA